MSQSFFKQWDDSLISLGLGALVVVVSGILLYNFFSTTSRDLLTDISANMQQSQSSDQQVVSATATPNPTIQAVADIVVLTPQPAWPVEQPVSTPAPTNVAIARATARPVATPTVAPIAQVTASPITVAQVTSTPAPVAQVTPAPAVAVSGSEFNTVRDNHVVARGETLWDLAERYYGSGFEWRQIAQANNIADAKTVEVGIELSIPRKGMISATQTEVPSNAVSSSETSAQAKIGVGGGATTVAQPVTHTVVRGENLSTLTMKYCGSAVSWTKIANDNRLENPRLIVAGQQIRFACQQ